MIEVHGYFFDLRKSTFTEFVDLSVQAAKRGGRVEIQQMGEPNWDSDASKHIVRINFKLTLVDVEANQLVLKVVLKAEYVVSGSPMEVDEEGKLGLPRFLWYAIGLHAWTLIAQKLKEQTTPINTQNLPVPTIDQLIPDERSFGGFSTN